MQNVKGISVTLLSPMQNHTANGGEKLLGNASSIKRRPDGRVYISGQMQRHALFSAIDRLNLEDEERAGTYVSNGDGVTNKIEEDLRADMGGFMHPKQGGYSKRRIAPVSASFAVAIEESDVGAIYSSASNRIPMRMPNKSRPSPPTSSARTTRCR